MGTAEDATNTEGTTNAAPRVLPRGRNAFSREIVFASQRGRMLEAMALAVAEKGYAAVSVADVIALAGVSRKTFYEHFSNKETCLLAAYDTGVELLLADVETAIDAAPGWLDAMRDGVRTYLESLAENPAFARTFLIEILAAGPAALERRGVVHERFAELIATGHAAARREFPALVERPAQVFRAYVGAVNELVTDHLARKGAETLPELLEQLLEIQLSLFTGPAGLTFPGGD
jgi:AcrR family transcriptional regulator